MKEQITRIGVYAVFEEQGRMLLIRQHRGPYAGKLDFPGGGIEFGESPEQALRRELLEELSMEFDSLQLLDNLTTVLEVPKTTSKSAYIFYQIGLIYRINNARAATGTAEFERIWIDPHTLSESDCSRLLWQFLCKAALQL